MCSRWLKYLESEPEQSKSLPPGHAGAFPQGMVEPHNYSDRVDPQEQDRPRNLCNQQYFTLGMGEWQSGKRFAERARRKWNSGSEGIAGWCEEGRVEKQ